MQTLRMAIRMRIAAPWQCSLDLRGPSKLVSGATGETYLSSCWYGGRQAACGKQRASLDPHHHRFLSSERSRGLLQQYFYCSSAQTGGPTQL